MAAHLSSRPRRKRTALVLAIALAIACGCAVASGPASASAVPRGSTPSHAAVANRSATASVSRLPAQAKAAFTPPTRSLTPAGDLNAAGSATVTSISARTAPARAQASPASYPLHTSGRWIENAAGHRVKLAAVNWDGFESAQYVVGGLDRQSVGSIASWIAAAGFNAVRIPWSNQMYESNPVVKPRYLSANPSLKGKHALDILTVVIDTLRQHHLMVILDDHQTNANIFCCSTGDGNGLWSSKERNTLPNYNEKQWRADWVGMATRYRGNPAVVGAELRNEIRGAYGVTPTWDEWRKAAEDGGDAVLKASPNLLIFVDGLSLSTDFTGVRHDPVVLSRPGHLVYAPHAYAQTDHYLVNSWSTWNGLRGSTTYAPAATEFDPRGQQPQLLVFTTATDGQVYEDAWSEPKGPWTGWYPIGQGSSGGAGDLAGSPAVAAFGQQVELFGRGPDGQVWGNVWTLSSGRWSGWYSIQGATNHDPAVTTYVPPGQQPQLLVFARGPGGQVYEKVYAQSARKWTNWYRIGTDGAVTGGDLSAAAFGNYQVQLFADGPNASVYQKIWTYGGGWSAWHSLGGNANSAPAAAAFGNYQVQVFVQGADRQVYTDVWTAELTHGDWTGNGSWSGWRSIGGQVLSAPAATQFGNQAGDQMEVFGVGTDDRVYTDVWGAGGYQGFRDAAGSEWGYILTPGQSYTAPLWVSEWGTCIASASGKCSSTDSGFFNDVTQYLRAGDIDFAAWQLGGEVVACYYESPPPSSWYSWPKNLWPPSWTNCAGRAQAAHSPGYDWYGLMNQSWNGPSDAANVARVEALAPPTQGP